LRATATYLLTMALRHVQFLTIDVSRRCTNRAFAGHPHEGDQINFAGRLLIVCPSP
jgi:hypothetical protein